MKTAFVYASSESFMPRTKVLEESMMRYHPEMDRYRIDIDTSIKPGTYVPGLARARLEATRKLLLGEYDAVIIIGSDCVLYNRLDLFTQYFYMNDVVLVPHVLQPPKNNGAGLYRTGHANADLIGFSKDGVEAIDWILSQEIVENPSSGIFYEQTWLSALPFFNTLCYVYKSPSVNFAYFNFHERELSEGDKGYLINDMYPLVMAQFSGWEEDKLPKTSKYGGIATGATLKLFQEYEAKVKANK